MSETKFDLEKRLIAMAVRVLRLTAVLPRTPEGAHIRGRLARSGTSCAANYGQAQSAESPQDFVHKLKVVLKELRETRIWLLILSCAELIKPVSRVSPLVAEAEELIKIFVTSIKTSTRSRT